MGRWLEVLAVGVVVSVSLVQMQRSVATVAREEAVELELSTAEKGALLTAVQTARDALVVEHGRQAAEKAELQRALQARAPMRRPRPPMRPMRAAQPPPPPLPPPLPATATTNLVDFPCSLRELKVAQVTKTCEIGCRDDRCDRAERLCGRLVECDAVVVQRGQSWIPLQEARAQGSLAGGSARLLRDATQRKLRDTSFAALAQSKWWGSTLAAPPPASYAPPAQKQRTYVVVSYGGCGSKMLAGWLSNLERQHGSIVKRVYHFHDSAPPDVLREIPPPPARASTQRDFRARRFPGGGKFKTDTVPVRSTDLDDYRVLYIVKDPVESLVSRYGYGHCMHLGGDCGIERDFPKLDQYAREGRDRMGLLSFFNAYTTPSDSRQFPIMVLNYHKLWDNPEALMDALGLPRSLAKTFPERTETVRNDLTGAAERNAAHTEAVRRDLDILYKPIIDTIRALPAVSIA